MTVYYRDHCHGLHRGMNSEQIALLTLAAEGIATGYFRTFDRGGPGAYRSRRRRIANLERWCVA